MSRAPPKAPATPLQLSKVPWATAALVAAMIVMTVWSLVRASSWFAAPPPILVELGGNTAFYTLDRGGLWRLVANKFLLGSVLGLAAIIPFFWVAAATFERIYGPVAHLLVFFGVTVLSSVMTLVLRDPFAVSAGAGAPTLAFATCLLVLAMRRASPALKQEGRPFLVKAGVTFALFALFLLPGVFSGSADYGSLGTGVLAGAVLGFTLVPRDSPRAAQAHVRLGGSIAVLAAFSVFAFAAVPQPPYLYSDHVRLLEVVQKTVEEVNSLNEQLEGRLQALMDASGESAQLVPYLEQEWLPRWEQLARGLKEAPRQEGLSNVAVLRRTEDYVDARIAFMKETTLGWKTDDDAAFIRAAPHRKRQADAWIAIEKANARVAAARVAGKR